MLHRLLISKHSSDVPSPDSQTLGSRTTWLWLSPISMVRTTTPVCRHSGVMMTPGCNEKALTWVPSSLEMDKHALARPSLRTAHNQTQACAVPQTLAHPWARHLLQHDADFTPRMSEHARFITETNRIHKVLFGVQNRTAFTPLCKLLGEQHIGKFGLAVGAPETVATPLVVRVVEVYLSILVRPRRNHHHPRRVFLHSVRACRL
jgi:hypothetical protein